MSRFVFGRLETPRRWIWLISINVDIFLDFFLQHSTTALRRQNSYFYLRISQALGLHEQVGTQIRQWRDQELEQCEEDVQGFETRIFGTDKIRSTMQFENWLRVNGSTLNISEYDPKKWSDYLYLTNVRHLSILNFEFI